MTDDRRQMSEDRLFEFGSGNAEVGIIGQRARGAGQRAESKVYRTDKKYLISVLCHP